MALLRALFVTSILITFTSFAHAEVKPQTGAPCGQDTDCSVGEVCKSGLCEVTSATTCMSNADCPGEQLCIGGICSDLFHAANRVKQMIAFQPQCISSGDCPPGDSCIGGQCKFGGCVSDVDCALGEKCVGGNCVAAPVPVRPAAAFGESCNMDGDCVNGEVCINNICQLNQAPQCSFDADCDIGEICVGGFCMSQSRFLEKVLHAHGLRTN